MAAAATLNNSGHAIGNTGARWTIGFRLGLQRLIGIRVASRLLHGN